MKNKNFQELFISTPILEQRNQKLSPKSNLLAPNAKSKIQSQSTKLAMNLRSDLYRVMHYENLMIMQRAQKGGNNYAY